MKNKFNKKLFNLETNKDFKSLKVKNIKFFKNILKKHGIFNIKEVFKVIKKSSNSNIFFINTNQKELVLRESGLNFFKELNASSKIVSELDNYFFKLIKLKNRCVFKKYKKVYIIYEKIDGNIFNGDFHLINKILSKILNLNFELKKKTIKGIKKNKYDKKKIINLNSFLIQKNIYKNFLSKKTLKLIESNNDYFRENFIKVKKLIIKRNLQIVHGDINHANIIINKNLIKFLDIEDIKVDNVKISLSYALFKLFRHCIYKNVRAYDLIIKKIKPLIYKKLILKNKVFKNENELFLFCFFKLMADISLIVENLNNNNKMYLYDFEKKILNLIELKYIFKNQ